MTVKQRMSSIVSGKKNEGFDPAIGTEAQLAQLGYEQGRQNTKTSG